MSLDAPMHRGPGRPRRDAEAIRPPIRGVDADRAAERAAKIRGDAVSADDGADAFYIAPEILERYREAGWSLEWKRAEVYGKADAQHQMGVMRRGWEPVPPDRHPDILVQQQGMILMERPLEITREAFQHNQVRARIEIARKEEQLSGGDKLAAGTELNARNTFAKRSIESAAIPD